MRQAVEAASNKVVSLSKAAMQIYLAGSTKIFSKTLSVQNKFWPMPGKLFSLQSKMSIDQATCSYMCQKGFPYSVTSFRKIAYILSDFVTNLSGH